MLGRTLFADFLARHGISRPAAATALGVSRHTVHYWLRDARPEPDLRLVIERWTRGHVPAWTWLTKDEAERVCAVVPLRVARASARRPPWETRGSSPLAAMATGTDG